MKKLIFYLLLTVTCVSSFAGGLVTNTNQSAMFTRFQCRDATLDIDAAFYNPAGLVHLSDGYYLSLNNQTMGHLKMITTEYSNIGDEPKEYTGKVGVPIFPALYGVFKSGKLAFSVGINPIAGDGKEKYNDGLPSIERKIADAVRLTQTRLEPLDALLENATAVNPEFSNITGYSVNMEWESKTLSMGYQGNIAYQINQYISLAAGARVVHARNWLRGTITDFTITGTNANGDFTMNPADYLRSVSSDVDTIPTPVLDALADELDIKSQYEASIIQTGVGITPIISVNYSPSLMTNWSLKYEFRTSLDIETHIVDGKVGDGQYKEGAITVADIPAMLSIGLTRRPSHRFMFYSGIHYYFDKPIDFDGSETLNIEMIEKNSYEFGFGGEYQVNGLFRISSGVLLSRPGVNAAYQQERRYALPSNTIGAGFGIRLSPLIDLNLGGSYTLYKKGEKSSVYDPEDGVTTTVDVTEYFDTRTWVLSVGVDFLFGENN